MVSTQLTKQLFLITDKKDVNQSLEMLLPEYIKLKIYFLKNQISQFEMKRNMTYHEFEKKSVNMQNGFSYELEQKYYEWGEKVALLQHYQKMMKECKT